jgi:uncharacterized protein (TIGR00369 family)
MATKGECVTTDMSPPIEHHSPVSQTDKIRELQVTIDKSPLYKFLGIRLDEVGDSKVRVSIELTPQVLTAEEAGGEHVDGSAMNAMAGMAAGILVYEVVGDPTSFFYRAQDTHVTHLAQPRSFPVTAEAQCVHRGKHMIVTEAVVNDGGGYPVERMSTTWAVIPLPNQGTTPS